MGAWKNGSRAGGSKTFWTCLERLSTSGITATRENGQSVNERSRGYVCVVPGPAKNGADPESGRAILGLRIGGANSRGQGPSTWVGTAGTPVRCQDKRSIRETAGDSARFSRRAGPHG